jgi:two-component system KDP operon response regulator KdpE
MKGARILAVDDDPAILRVLRRALEAAGYDIESLPDGKHVIERAAAFAPDVILLDLVLPGADGIDLARQLAGGRASVIVLSAIGDDRKKVEALDAGADDYLTKPFSVEELLARIRVALRRRAGAATGSVLEAGLLRIDLGSRETTVGGRAVSLTPKEFELLRLLATHPAHTADVAVRGVGRSVYQRCPHPAHLHLPASVEARCRQRRGWSAHRDGPRRRLPVERARILTLPG